MAASTITNSFAAIRFCVQHASEQHASGGDDRAARFEQHVEAKRFGGARDHGGIICARGDFFVGVTRTESAANIQISQVDSGAAQRFYVARKTLECRAERIECDDLRTDMRADSLPGNIFAISVREIEALRVGPIHAKFVIVPPRRNMRMAAGGDIRIDADGYGWDRSIRGAVAHAKIPQAALRARLPIRR